MTNLNHSDRPAVEVPRQPGIADPGRWPMKESESMVHGLQIRVIYVCIGLFGATAFTLFHVVSLDASRLFQEMLSVSRLPFPARTGITTGTSTSILVCVWLISLVLIVLAALGRKSLVSTSLAILCLSVSGLAFYGLMGYWYVLSK